MYREVGLMQVVEILRRWQAGDSARVIARGMGLARDTVRKYLREARRLGLTAHGPAPTNEQIVALSRLSQTAPPARTAPRAIQLEPHQQQIARWLQDDELQLTRVAELLGQQGVPVAYSTLRRYIRDHGIGATARDTVRMPDTAPGEVAEFDFGTLGRLTDATSGKRHLVWALNIVLVFSRHQFVWPLIRQTLDEVIAGLEAAWRFFGGIPRHGSGPPPR
jgi:transposase